MFQAGDYVVYGGKGLCLIESIGVPSFQPSKGSPDYYFLRKTDDDSRIYVPVDTPSPPKKSFVGLLPFVFDQNMVEFKAFQKLYPECLQFTGREPMNAKQAARAAKKNAKKEKSFEERFSEHNLIPRSEVKRIKELLDNPSRTEEEWTVIKDILASHALIVTCPTTDDLRIRMCNHMLVDENRLIAFTNVDDATLFMKEYIKRNFPEGIYFQLGSLPFEEAVETSDRERIDLFIDPPYDDQTMFMYYSKGRIKAAMLKKP